MRRKPKRHVSQSKDNAGEKEGRTEIDTSSMLNIDEKVKKTWLKAAHFHCVRNSCSSSWKGVSGGGASSTTGSVCTGAAALRRGGMVRWLNFREKAGGIGC